MASNKIGYFFQDKLKAALQKMKETEALFFHQLKDSHAAGNFMPNSPADFLVAYDGHTELWECKASAKYLTLRQCLSDAVDEGQIGHHTEWLKTGNDSCFLFYSDRTGGVECWEGSRIVKHRNRGIPLTYEDSPIMEIGLDEMNPLLLDLFK